MTIELIRQGILDFLVREVMPFVKCLHANKILSRKLSKLEKANEDTEFMKQFKNLSIDKVGRFASDVSARKQGIEDKAKANMFSTTLAIPLLISSLIFFTSRDLKSMFCVHQLIGCLSLLVLGVLNLLAGGFFALRAFKIEKFYRLAPSDEAYLQDKSETERKLLLARNIELNNLMNSMRANSVSTSHLQIRNGLILFSAFYIVFVFFVLMT